MVAAMEKYMIDNELILRLIERHGTIVEASKAMGRPWRTLMRWKNCGFSSLQKLGDVETLIRLHLDDAQPVNSLRPSGMSPPQNGGRCADAQDSIVPS